ncbi:MAG: hypothetical protein ABSG97_05235 [Sedimentisphaerales bacterium]
MIKPIPLFLWKEADDGLIICVVTRYTIVRVSSIRYRETSIEFGESTV